MKKWLILLTVSVSMSVSASPKSELSERLSKTEGFSASFSQIVTAPDGEVIQRVSGTADIARPSMFRWSTIEPDETELISDGDVVWYYEPFLEQVSIYNQKQAIGQTPFVLLTRNRQSDWDNYHVSQKDNRFTLEPVSENATQGQFIIDVTAKGKIEGFSVVEQDGQISQFTFNTITIKTPAQERFTFTPPKGVEVYDERGN
ncbi:outer membrane lipoprotein chaperone LolA [Vibrio sp. S9_S30]|uniref:outer membrane lipoprotein chaperone LolA n=1 Tax=Vibrio sp. S9_S30 TaxID=2720226 RepID=UPI001680B2DB|nr:outer membrane lipoprotein chaperone LolA [Vibrio sp. S9_S30]MBD1557921.1 outer membrane lipoprotein chaperone LolA [Vibrio sp. S9_S30]